MRVFSPVRTLLFAALLLASWAGTAEAQSRCKAPDAVCAAAERVFAIASFDPTASAARRSISGVSSRIPTGNRMILEINPASIP